MYGTTLLVRANLHVQERSTGTTRPIAGGRLSERLTCLVATVSLKLFRTTSSWLSEEQVQQILLNASIYTITLCRTKTVECIVWSHDTMKNEYNTI